MKTKLKLSRYDDEEIENLGFVRPVTNSEVQSLSCTRSYTYEYVETISAERINKNFAYGACFHMLLEHILKEVKKTDEMQDLKQIKSYIFQKSKVEIVDLYFSDQPTHLYDASEITEMKMSIIDRMYHSIDGWYYNWKKNIHSKYKILDIEKILYSPIVFGNKIYKECFLLAKEEFENRVEYRQLYTGELADYKRNNFTNKDRDSISFEIVQKELPFYKVGKADVVLIHRERKSIWILDHKTTKSVQSYASKTQFSLQLTGYCSILRDMIKNGLYKEYGDIYIGGIIWDFCCSDISSAKVPKLLKTKKLSKSQSKIVPFWLYEQAVTESNLNKDEYQDHIEFLKMNSNKFFSIKVEDISNSDLDRVKIEDYVLASRLYKTRNFVELTDFNKPMDWDLRSSRFTICNIFGSCKFSNNCFANSKPHDIYNLSRQQKMSWITPKY